MNKDVINKMWQAYKAGAIRIQIDLDSYIPLSDQPFNEWIKMKYPELMEEETEIEEVKKDKKWKITLNQSGLKDIFNHGVKNIIISSMQRIRIKYSQWKKL